MQINNCKMFDGKKYYSSVNITITDDIISDIKVNKDNSEDSKYFVMPGLIDSHTHTDSENQLKRLRECGILCTCSVVASNSIKNIKYLPKVYSSYSMALGGVSDGYQFVENEVRNNADYIKVIIEDKPRMSFKKIDYNVLCDIVKCSHKYNKKVAAHAVTIEDYNMAIDAGVDILIHIPLREVLSDEIVNKIKNNNIAVIPTLVMMEKFSKLWIMGYHKSDFEASLKSVKKLFDNDVEILTGTDSNDSVFAPSVKFGSSMYEEIKLIHRAGIPNINILESAATIPSKVFEIGDNILSVGSRANLIVIEGNPLINIEDIKNINSVFIDGKNISKGDI